MKLHRYVDHQRLHIVTKDVISLSISVLLLFRHYISHKIIFGAPSSGGVLCSACGAFIILVLEALSQEFRTGVPWEPLYADDLAVIADTLEECITKLKAWKKDMEKRGLRVNLKKTKFMNYFQY